MEYLVSWGESFWEQTEYRVQEITSKLEKDIRISLGSKSKLLDGQFTRGNKVSEEERKVLCDHAQQVVNNVQIRKLFEVVDLLSSDLLDDEQKPIYIVIDRLDENWIEDKFRYRIIRALIEAVGEFSKIRTAKIIIALRRDLVDRVIRETRDAGFQEEKYRDLYLEISWSKKQLLDMLDLRIAMLVRRQYTTQTVGHKDLFPETIDNQPIGDYLIDRTLYRPRDLILFFNQCIKTSLAQQDGKAFVPVAIIKSAEREHSRDQLRSLADEWHSNYPDLMHFVPFLKKRKSSFRLSDISQSEIEYFCLSVAVELDGIGLLGRKACEVVEHPKSANDFLVLLLRIFYRVGLVGLKIESYEKNRWSYLNYSMLSEAELSSKTLVTVSPLFISALGCIR